MVSVGWLVGSCRDGSFELGCMMQVKMFGVWEDVVSEEEQRLFLSETDSGQWRDYDREKVIRYLNSGKLFIVCPGVVYNRLSAQPDRPVGSMSILTDGVWAWPEYMGMYVEQFDYVVPLDFLRHMEASSWCVAEEIDLSQLEFGV